MLAFPYSALHTARTELFTLEIDFDTFHDMLEPNSRCTPTSPQDKTVPELHTV